MDSGYLSRIWADKQREVEALKTSVPLAELKARLPDLPPTRGFQSALQRTKNPVALIAEIKRASPSRGVIRADTDPAQIARIYEESGADCISVLTDEAYFQGSLSDLTLVRTASTLPLLRKDFIVDEYQLYESRIAGADAVLLIVAGVRDVRVLKEWRELAESLGLDVLVEVHSEGELQTALESGARLIGINNRNLSDFTIDFETTFRLLAHLPPGVVVVSESGIEGREQVQRLRQGGVHGMLIGESLMRAPEPAQKIRALLQPS